MKKTVICVFFMILCIILVCGCDSESELERAIKDEKAAQERLEDAVDDYYDFQEDKAIYNYYQQQF